MFTVKQVAEQLNIATQSVYQLIQSGKLPVHRFGAGRGTIRVSQEDLDQFIEACRQVASPRDVPRVSRSALQQPLKHIRL
jgi:excisionase family DNA binding protein